jgi:hypothetical protein
MLYSAVQCRTIIAIYAINLVDDLIRRKENSPDVKGK